jgi:antitoxin (DNA-binding transcriptional repressor) of toxin-antitoxin stability system
MGTNIAPTSRGRTKTKRTHAEILDYDNLIIMESHISATEAARRFSDLLNRVVYRREEFVIERGGQPVCRIVPAGPPRCTLADLSELLSAIPKPDPIFWDEVETLTKNQSEAQESSW